MTPSPPPLEGISVLLVDDEADELAVLGAVMRSAGAEVTVALKVEDALRALQAGLPDVVVSDIIMPGHDGFTLIHRIRRLPAGEGGDLPVLAISALDTPEQRRYAAEEGFTEFMPKPVVGELVAVVARLAGLVRGLPARG